MNDIPMKHSSAWVSFVYGSFAASIVLTGGGIFFLPVDVWIKGYLAMGMAMIVQTAISVTKTIRDNEESGRLHRKIEEARTEKLLSEHESKL